LNAGSADIYGIELESDFILSDNWGFNIGVSYTKSELKNTQMVTYEEFPSFAPDGDVSGNQLLRQPEWMGNATLRFDYPAFSDWDVTGRGDVIYQDKVYNGNDNQSWYPSRTYLNLALGLTNGRWTLEVWGRNLGDDDSPTGGFRDVYFNNTSDVTQSLPPSSVPAADFFPWRFTVTHPRLRTFGATVRWKFGAMAP
jgi:outer membrane receptor protein involved in Fe transport